jgi:HemY protein
MLWSILKIAVFLALVVAVTFGAAYLLEVEGGVRIVMAGVELNLSPIKAVIGLSLLVMAIWLLLKLAALLVALLRFINGDETALSRHFDRNRQEKGYRALSEGMLALASGEGQVAMARAARADRYLNKPELTSLLMAQAAEMSGNRPKAEEIYKRLVAHDRTRFVGVRGLLRQKLADGDTDTALQLARTAFALRPAHAEIQDTLLRLQAGHEDWTGARETLGAKLKHGTLPRDVHKRRDAVRAAASRRARPRSRPTACRRTSFRRPRWPRRPMSRRIPNATPRASCARRGRPSRTPPSPPPSPRSSPTRRQLPGSSALPS